jgi:hypothetical protein
MVPFGHEIAIRALGTALAGLSVAFAGYMITHGEGTIRVNGIEHLSIFAQPRGTPAAVKGLVLPSLSDPAPLDLTATGSLSAGFRPAPGPVEIVGARSDRVWLRIDGAIRAAAPGDDVPRVGHIASIVPRDGGWALLDGHGATLLAVTKKANGAAMFGRGRIFE